VFVKVRFQEFQRVCVAFSTFIQSKPCTYSSVMSQILFLHLCISAELCVFVFQSVHVQTLFSMFRHFTFLCLCKCTWMHLLVRKCPSH